MLPHLLKLADDDRFRRSLVALSARRAVATDSWTNLVVADAWLASRTAHARGRTPRIFILEDEGVMAAAPTLPRAPWEGARCGPVRHLDTDDDQRGKLVARMACPQVTKGLCCLDANLGPLHDDSAGL